MKLLTIGSGYRTYLVSALLILIVVLKKWFGIEIPGVTVEENWLHQILTALGLSTLRAGISAQGNKSNSGGGAE